MTDTDRRVRSQSLSEIPRLRRPAANWGPWQLDAERYVLVHAEQDHSYEIDLEDCTSSAEVLDWVCQIAGKGWGDDRTVSGLVRALDEVLFPQAHLCPSGKSRQLSRKRVRELIDGRHEGDDR